MIPNNLALVELTNVFEKMKLADIVMMNTFLSFKFVPNVNDQNCVQRATPMCVCFCFLAPSHASSSSTITRRQKQKQTHIPIIFGVPSQSYGAGGVAREWATVDIDASRRMYTAETANRTQTHNETRVHLPR